MSLTIYSDLYRKLVIFCTFISRCVSLEIYVYVIGKVSSNRIMFITNNINLIIIL